jgi:hypothetical protein
MSFWLGEVYKLEAQGGAAWDEYCTLVAACDASQHGSPAHMALREFQQAWVQDPNLTTERARERAVARAEAAAIAARVAG